MTLSSVSNLLPRETEKRHCSDCVLAPEIVGKISRIVLIFLDMDGVMIADRLSANVNEQIVKTARGLFGDRKISDFEQRVSQSYHLDQNSVNRLMQVIRAIQSVGMQVGIVISSAWRENGTLDQVCFEMFANQLFTELIIGRTPSSEKHSNRGEEIAYWLKEHSAGKKYVIFDDCDDGIRNLFAKKFIQTFLSIEETHVERALITLGVKQKLPSHCDLCNIFEKKSYDFILFLDLEDLLEEGNLREPLRKKLLKTMTKGHETYRTSESFPVVETRKQSLCYLIKKIESIGKTVGIVVTTKFSDISTNKLTISKFKEMFFYKYLLGRTLNGVAHWVQQHDVKHHAVIDFQHFPQGTKKEVDRFFRGLNILPRPYSIPKNRHCNYCILDGNDNQRFKDLTVIFLDVAQTLTMYEWKGAREFDQDAVAILMLLIETLRKHGNEVGIVITAKSRLESKTKEVCFEKFASQPFSNFIIGRTHSTLESDPEWVRTQKTYPPYKLNFIANSTDNRYWLREHDIDLRQTIIINADGKDSDLFYHSIQPKSPQLISWDNIRSIVARFKEENRGD